MSELIQAPIIHNIQVSDHTYRLDFLAPLLAAKCKPGQFLHLRCGTTADPLLRRPISLHDVNEKEGIITLLYRVVGAGTAKLAAKKSGELLDVMGPLGNGFQLNNIGGKVAVVGGGIGAAPLLYLIKGLLKQGIKPLTIIGARCAEELYSIQEIIKLGVPLQLATDDGSVGSHGTVMPLLKEALPGLDHIFTCGPGGMMQGVAKAAAEKNIPTQVSLEERMACGVGACLSCAVKIKTDKGTTTVKRVCADGPIFWGSEVAWDE